MAVHIITGKLGAGKTLAAVWIIQQAMRRGNRVATNLDIFPEKLRGQKCTSTVHRIPDKPTVQHLDQIGTGDGRKEEDSIYNEDEFGVLVLDELGTWLNARSWNDKERGPVLDWFLHARKKRWHVYLIVQDVSLLDSQLRQSLCEHLVVCRRLDRMKIPWPVYLVAGSLIWLASNFWVALAVGVGWMLTQEVYKFRTGRNLGLPKFHIAHVFYGDNTQAMKADTWRYSGKDLYAGYSTGQCFSEDSLWLNGERVDMRAPYTILSAWHLVGRYEKARRFPSLSKLVVYSVLTVAGWFTGRSQVDQARHWGMVN